MDIAVLSMIISQSKAQTAASIAIMKKAMDTGKSFFLTMLPAT